MLVGISSSKCISKEKRLIIGYSYLFSCLECNKGKKIRSDPEENITHLQLMDEYGAVDRCWEGDLDRKMSKSKESILGESAKKLSLSSKA